MTLVPADTDYVAHGRTHDLAADDYAHELALRGKEGETCYHDHGLDI